MVSSSRGSRGRYSGHELAAQSVNYWAGKEEVPRPTASAVRVSQERLEAKIHMLLDMAMKQGEARLIRSKIHTGAPVGRHHHCILDDARGCFSVNLHDLELMTMQMQRMRIIGPIVKRQPVSHTLLEQKLPGVRIRFSVNSEAVKFARAARHLFKHHVQSVGRRRFRWRLAENCIVPNRFWGWFPIGSPTLIGILNHNTQLGRASC